MATARTATLVDARLVAGRTRVLELALPDGDDMRFVGGQYIIVNTGVTLPSGKLAKRAYSLISADAEQRRVRIAVKRLDGGPGSAFLHEVPVGAEVPFSGPWGSFVATDGADDPSLIVATDTGITAAIGLVRGAGFAPRRARTTLLWATDASDADLVPAAWLDELRQELGVTVERAALAGDRVADATARALELAQRIAARDAWLCGDGKVIYPVRDALVAAGIAEARVRLESFFNNPQRKAP